MINNIELLAPAGSMESLIAAVNAGCDAVYLGGSKFSARAYASNFNEEKIIFAVNYCHLYGVKVYITVNTLLHDAEIKEAIEYIDFLQRIKVDGIILQDLGLAYLIQNNFKNLEIHASTQMSIHNGEGARFFHDKGFKRIVLGRELSLKEIEYISKDLGIETEIFIHGALCICYSGQCLMSSLIGGRSGNRGKCAQTCRLPYKIIKENNGNIDISEEKFYLSPKDLNFIPKIKEIIASGVTSLKIEGRMKKPEYVAGVVSSYKEAINAVKNNEKFNLKEKNEILTKLFNREGFSQGYLEKNIGKDMMAYNFPKNSGISIGKALGKNKVKLYDSLTMGDGISNREDGFIVTSIEKDNKKVDFAKKGDIVTLKQGKFLENQTIYKTNDKVLMDSLKIYYDSMYLKKIKINLEVYIKLGEEIYIKTSYKGKEYITKGVRFQRAEKAPLSKNRVEENLRKTGNTPFEVENINFISFEDGYIRMSDLNDARRNLLLQIEKDYNKTFEITKRNLNLNRGEKNKKTFSKYFVTVNSKDQLKACIEMGVEEIAVDIFMRKCDIKIIDIIENKFYLKIPNIIKGEWDSIIKIIEENKNKIKGIVTGNIGVISKYYRELTIISDYKLNLFNKYSLDFVKDYVDMATVSVELNRKEIRNMVKSAPIATSVLVYGKIEVMISEYCPIGSTEGGKSKSEDCNIPCERGEFSLCDRKGENFLVKTDKFCRSHIYNSKAINLSDMRKDLESLNVDSFRMDFIDEDYNMTKKILRGFCKGKPLEGDFTKGHYKRGVE